MSAYFRCSICGGKVAGSNLIDRASLGQVGIVLAIHLIDGHWDLVERIRATAGDGEARLDLNRQLAQELS